MEAENVQNVENAGSPPKEVVEKQAEKVAKKKEIESYLNDSLGCLAIAFVMFGIVIYFLKHFK